MELRARVPQKAAHCDTKLSHSANGGLATRALNKIRKILSYDLKFALIKYFLVKYFFLFLLVRPMIIIYNYD